MPIITLLDDCMNHTLVYASGNTWAETCIDKKKIRISDSHSGEYEDDSLLGYGEITWCSIPEDCELHLYLSRDQYYMVTYRKSKDKFHLCLSPGTRRRWVVSLMSQLTKPPSRGRQSLIPAVSHSTKPKKFTSPLSVAWPSLVLL
jgi:hypothetical protein